MSKIKKWITGSGTWAMVDQGIVSSGNFLLTVMLARTLGKTEYGIYVVTLGALLVANAFHSGLIAYPVSVLGAHLSRDEVQHFASNALLVTYAFLLPVAAVLGVSTYVLSKNLGLCLCVITAMVCWQTHETLRRCLMSRLRYRITIIGDAVTYLGQIALIVFLATRHLELQAKVGFQVIAAASLVGAVVHMGVIRLRSPKLSSAYALGKESVRLGRWSLFSILGYWGTVSLLPWALALRSLAEVANYQTMMNVVQVVNPVMFSISNLVVPSVAHEMKDPQGDTNARRITFVHMAQGMVLLAPLFIGLLFIPGVIMKTLYGHSRGYAENDDVMRILVLGAVLTYTGHILTAYFLGKKEVKIVARIQVAATVIALICAASLIPHWGIDGAALSYAGMGIARNSLLLAALRKKRPPEPEYLRGDFYVDVSPVPPTDGT